MRMRRFLPDRVTSLSFLSGLVLACSFPRPDLASVAWIALVPVFVLMYERPFRSGFAAGVGFFGLVLYWLNIVMTTYGKMHPVFSVVAYLLLVGYLALFFAVATWAACRLRERLGLSPLLTLPVLWVALEFLRSFLLSGFPWASLGYSQQSHLVLIQSVDLFGVYGLSFLIVLVNVVLAGTVRALAKSSRSALPWKSAITAALLLAVNSGYGYFRLAQDLNSRERTLSVSLIQGNIDQSLKWHPANQQKTVALYRNLSLAAVGGKQTDLLIWPESAAPFYFQDAGPLSNVVVATASQADSWLLFGSPAYEYVNRRPQYLNSAFLLSGEGKVLGRSDKVHLVPFGEYVPMGKYLPFIDKLVVGIGDFSPGTISPLPMNGTEIGVLVCYEAIFPELAREWVRQGSDLLVNITNDAWFGRSSAPYQHLAMTRFRAIENRIWIARAANTGISAFIAPSGAIIAQSPIFETLYLQGEVGIGSRPTLYTRFGDVIPALFIVLCIVWLARTRKRLGSS